MATLVTLQTNLKSLSYGRDRTDRGDSNQPYITTPIPDASAPRENAGINSQDFLWRGGIGAPLDAGLDVRRLSKYFSDFKNTSGLLFVAKQNLLSRIAPATQASGNQSSNDKWQKAALNEGIYTPLSTLAQAGIGFIGGHVEKQGIIGVRTYSDVVEKVIGSPEDGNGNRLVDLTNLNKGVFSGPEIFSYSGGPNSIVGIGKTTIKYATNNTGAILRTLDNESFTKSYSKNETGVSNSTTNRDLLKDEFIQPLGVSEKYATITNGEINFNGFGGDIYAAEGGGYTGQLAAVSKATGVWAPLANTEESTGEIFNLALGKVITPSIYNRTQNPTDKFKNPLGVSYSYSKLIGGDSLELAGNVDIFTNKGEGLASIERFGNNTQYGWSNTFSTSVYKTKDDKIPYLTPLTQYQNKYKPLTSQTKLEDESPTSTSDLFNLSFPNPVLDLNLSVNETQGFTNNSPYQNIFGKKLVDIEGNSFKFPEGIPDLKITSRTFENLFTQEEIESQNSPKDNKANPGSTIQDFRAELIRKNSITKSTILSTSPDYSNALKTIDGESTSRINYASPGQRGNVINYTKGKFVNNSLTPSITDRINALPLYKSSNVISSPAKNDLVKFRIAAIDTNNPSQKTYMHFRAFIDAFSDNYNASWNEQKYVGRGEPLYKYDSFKRNINLSFTAVAQSKPEIMVMYRKLNYLASNLAPDYTDAGFMSGPLIQLTLGGWCYELPGFISGLTLEVPQEATWEIAIDGDPEKGKGDQTVKEMPHLVKVTGLTFTPIHTFRPAKMKISNPMRSVKDNLADNNGYGDERYLALKAVNNNYDSKVNWYTK